MVEAQSRHRGHLAGSVKVGFVGLFDTVAAIGRLRDGLDVRDGDEGGLQLKLAPDCARQVVHVVARDEIRANFMLTSAAPHREITLPGAHSDIGGGYHGDHEGPLLLTRPQGHDEPTLGLQPGQVPPAAQLAASRAHREALQAYRQWQQRLGPDGMQLHTWHGWYRQRRAGSASVVPEVRLRIYSALVLERPIDWRYQLIPLRLMHRLAMEAGAPMKTIPSDEDHRLPPELEPIMAQLLEGKPLTPTQTQLLARSYLHQSAHWNFRRFDSSDKPTSVLETFYVHRPDPSGQRGVKPNE